MRFRPPPKVDGEPYSVGKAGVCWWLGCQAARQTYSSKEWINPSFNNYIKVTRSGTVLWPYDSYRASNSAH